MKSSGLFPHKAGYKRGSHNSAAGNTSAPYSPPDTDGYKDGMVGWRWGRQGGGHALSPKKDSRPIANDTSLEGEGGLACDKSVGNLLYDKGKPAQAKAR